MPDGIWIGLVGALIGGFVTLAGLLLAWPKLKGEARRLNAEASKLEWQTLHDEIQRLAGQTKSLRADLDTIKTDAAAREGELDRENRRLRDHVRRLERRVSGLEAILNIGPPTPEQQAELDKLNRIERNGQ